MSKRFKPAFLSTIASVILIGLPGALGSCSGKDEGAGELPAPETQTPQVATEPSSVVQPAEQPLTPGQEGVAKVEGIVPGIEPEKEPPLYGRAVWNVVTIYSKPDMHSMHLGYLRAGAVVILDEERVTDKSPKKPRCKKGWWRLSDGGGYICSSRGVEAAKELIPSTLYPSPPGMDAPMPYRYGHIMTDLTPLYERLPKPEEEVQVEAWIAKKKKELKLKELEKQAAEQEAKKKEAAAKAAASKAIETPPDEPTAAPEPPPADEASPDEATQDKQAEDQSGQAPEPAGEQPPPDDAAEPPVEQEPEPEEEKDELPFDYVRHLMLKGFYVSIDRETASGGIKWYRTVRGQYVKAEKVFPVDIRTRGGAELEEGFGFPAGIVLREDIFERTWNTKKNHIIKNKDALLKKFFVFPIKGKKISKVKEIDAEFYEIDDTGDRLVLSWSVVPIMKAEPPPPEVPEGGKWIHVDTGNQTLTAYEGKRPVFLTLISAGAEKKDEEFATVKGTFNIQSKHVSTTMDNLALEDGSYSIEDVPWTMYFHASYATHGAFWHSIFGHQRSHGCVNMTPKDARWLFMWSEPALPFGWHGVVSTKERPGTFVKVTD